ncbi:MAG: cation:proton antiporter [Candidatus Rokubacteria bacterium]|nr:cation:proton antiporter [Candidatus Rokubacteria bacterium]
MRLGELLLGLVIVWLAAKLAGEAMERVGQTAVLGELLAGVIVGPAVLGLVRESEILQVLAEIGVIILLFEIGLESDLSELLRAGLQSTVVALGGIACPFALGYALAVFWGKPALVAVFIGATLTATSVGITARVLSDLGRLQDAAARVVLGAAILDDVLGLVILAVVTGLVQTGVFSLATVALILAKALVFLVLAVALGIRFAPTLLVWVGRMRARGSLIVYAVLFCVLLAALSERIGLAAIIGAFAAGLILARTEPRAHIEEQIKPVADLFVPVFFVTVGMKVDPAALNPFGEGALGFALALTAVAVLGKLAAGLGVYRRGVRRWPVGVGMIPRGEVGLIFAGVGLANRVIDQTLYAAVIIMVMASTFIVPPWLKALYRRP